MTTRVVMDQKALNDLLHSKEGPVAKELVRRGMRCENAAKRLCPVDTGRLRASITSDLQRDERGLFARIGSDVFYAAYVELGTRHMAAQPYLRPALREAT